MFTPSPPNYTKSKLTKVAIFVLLVVFLVVGVWVGGGGGVVKGAVFENGDEQETGKVLPLSVMNQINPEQYPLHHFETGAFPTPAITDINLDEALVAALRSYSSSNLLYLLQDVRIFDNFAYAIAQGVDDNQSIVPYQVVVVLAKRDTDNNWHTLAPGAVDPEEYNDLLSSFPDNLLDEAAKAYLSQPIRSSSPANFSGHKLPWPAGQTGYMVRRDVSGHENQVDFDIPGDVYASKPGTVVFVKESSSFGECNFNSWRYANMVVVQHGSEYSWYVHLAPNSVPVSVGDTIGFGTKVGVEGSTGYACGAHLHYMASTGYTKWTDPEKPEEAPWGTGITAVDFVEVAWNQLTRGTPYTSQNGSGGGGTNTPVPSGQAKLFSLANFGGSVVWSGGTGFSNDPNANSYSLQLPNGWSAKTWRGDGQTGEERCWPSSVANLQDDGWHLAIQSIEVFNYNACPAPTPTPPADYPVMMCTTDNATGECYRFPYGARDLSGDPLNDRIRSIHSVASGKSVMLFREGGFRGTAECYNGPRVPLPADPNWDLRGQVTGVQVFNSSNCPSNELVSVVMYKNPNFGDFHWGVGITANLFNITEIPGRISFNDVAQSMRIPAGRSVIAYDHTNGGGEASGCLTGNVADLGSLKGKVSSIRVFGNTSCYVPPTVTPIPPTATPVPTATPRPPTATPVPTATPIPPTATPIPTPTSPAGDSYEPDNSAAQAKVITDSVPQVHSIRPVGDVDWVKFTLNGPREISLYTDGSSGDTELWLYNSSLQEIGYDDDSGNGYFSWIRRLCQNNQQLPAGTYYAKVSEYGNDEEITSYTITLLTAPCAATSTPVPPTNTPIPTNTPLPSQAKLFSLANYGGSVVWSGGAGFSNGPSANSYSLQLPSGWSAKTWRGDNKGGEERCWTSSVNNLQDHGWHNAIQSIEVFNYNACSSAPTPTSTPPPSHWKWQQEAETGVVVSPLAVRSDSGASNCQYVDSPVAWSNGTVTFQFNAPASGNYYLWARAMGLAWNQNSFLFAFDSSQYQVFEIHPKGGDYGEWTWDWKKVTANSSGLNEFWLNAGTHILSFKAREANSRLDRVLITNQSSYTPGSSDISHCATATNTPSPMPTATRTPTTIHTPTRTPTPRPTATHTPTPTATPVHTGERTFASQVNSTFNDTSVRVNDRANDPSNRLVRIGQSAVVYAGGFRFTDVSIPQGARILGAKMSVHYGGWHRGAPIALIIRGEQANHSAPLDNNQPLINERPVTNASVEWTIENIPASNWLETPNLSSVIQQIVNRSDWHEGSALSLIVFNNATDANPHYIDFAAFDLNPTYGAQLLIRYISQTPTPTPTHTHTPIPTPTRTHTPTPTTSAFDSPLPTPNGRTVFIPLIIRSQSAVTVISVWTATETQEKTVFHQYEPIHYYAQVYNATNQANKAWFKWKISGPCGNNTLWEGELETTSGIANWFLKTIVPSCNGIYTYSVEVIHNGQTSVRETTFTVLNTSSEQHECINCGEQIPQMVVPEQ